MDEHRIAARRRALKGAQIIFNDGASVIDCIVRDVSETGAKLKIPSPLGVPDTFTLSVQADNTRRKCRVAWRRATEMGVAFE